MARKAPPFPTAKELFGAEGAQDEVETVDTPPTRPRRLPWHREDDPTPETVDKAPDSEAANPAASVLSPTKKLEEMLAQEGGIAAAEALVFAAANEAGQHVQRSEGPATTESVEPSERVKALMQRSKLFRAAGEAEYFELQGNVVGHAWSKAVARIR